MQTRCFRDYGSLWRTSGRREHYGFSRRYPEPIGGLLLRRQVDACLLWGVTVEAEVHR